MDCCSGSDASYTPGTMAHNNHRDANFNIDKGKKPAGARPLPAIKTGLALTHTCAMEGMPKTGPF
jgi:hypothetical protein